MDTFFKFVAFLSILDSNLLLDRSATNIAIVAKVVDDICACPMLFSLIKNNHTKIDPLFPSVLALTGDI